MDSEMKEMFIKIKDELMEEQVVREVRFYHFYH